MLRRIQALHLNKIEKQVFEEFDLEQPHLEVVEDEERFFSMMRNNVALESHLWLIQHCSILDK